MKNDDFDLMKVTLMADKLDKMTQTEQEALAYALFMALNADAKMRVAHAVRVKLEEEYE